MQEGQVEEEVEDSGAAGSGKVQQSVGNTSQPSAGREACVVDSVYKVGTRLRNSKEEMVITTQKVSFCAFNSLCFKHLCVVVLHLYPNWHVKDLAMTSNHICGYFQCFDSFLDH